MHGGVNEILSFCRPAQTKTNLKTTGQRPCTQEETLKGIFVVLLWPGVGRGHRSVFCWESMTTSREGREHSQPSGLNYLLTQIIKFQGPHGSGAAQSRGRPRAALGEQVAAQPDLPVRHTKFCCSPRRQRRSRDRGKFLMARSRQGL